MYFVCLDSSKLVLHPGCNRHTLLDVELIIMVLKKDHQALRYHEHGNEAEER